MHKECKCKEFCLQVRDGGEIGLSDVITYKDHWCRAIMWRSLDVSLAIEILRFDKEYEIKCECKFSNPLYVL